MEKPYSMASMIEKSWRKVSSHQRMLTSAVVCNPTLVLYSINKVLNFFRPMCLDTLPFDARIDPFLDVHAHDKSCKVFVLLMVALQLVLYVPRTTKPSTLRVKGTEKSGTSSTTYPLASRMATQRSLEKLNISAYCNPRVPKT